MHTAVESVFPFIAAPHPGKSRLVLVVLWAASNRGGQDPLNSLF
jgi:hypothetical protein